MFIRVLVKKGGGRTRSLFERKNPREISEAENNAQRKVKKENPREMSENYLGIMMRIFSGNYHLVYNIT